MDAYNTDVIIGYNIENSVLMGTTKNRRMMVLLLESGSGGHDLGQWLSANGFVAWRANDVSHAMEELSDFTVRRRPDVVLLEVAGLPQRFDAVMSALRGSSGGGTVAVCAYAGDRPANAGEQYFASNLDQLRGLVSRQVCATN